MERLSPTACPLCLFQINEAPAKAGRHLQLSTPLTVDLSHCGKDKGLEVEVGERLTSTEESMFTSQLSGLAMMPHPPTHTQ
jgi:hypothetical protein